MPTRRLSSCTGSPPTYFPSSRWHVSYCLLRSNMLGLYVSVSLKCPHSVVVQVVELCTDCVSCPAVFRSSAVRSLLGLPALARAAPAAGAVPDAPLTFASSPFRKRGAADQLPKQHAPPAPGGVSGAPAPGATPQPRTSPQSKKRRPARPTFSSVESAGRTYDVTPLPSESPAAKTGKGSKQRRKH